MQCLFMIDCLACVNLVGNIITDMFFVTVFIVFQVSFSLSFFFPYNFYYMASLT